MNPARPLSRDTRLRVLLTLGLLAIFGLVWFRSAWMSDDAYITLRTVQNVLEGFGPTFNPGERVQAFTHPLWFLLLIPFSAATGEGYFSTLALSLLLSLAALALVALALARSWLQALFAIAASILSKAFIDFSSSGLENPLTNLCLVFFYVAFFRTMQGTRRVFWVFLAAALCGLTRTDLLLLCIPPLVLVLAQEWRARSASTLRLILAAGAGLLPLILWHVFALGYYGLLFPNTFYAKLPINVALATWLTQGANYFLNSLRVDPVTLFVIAAGILLAFLSRSVPLSAGALGILLYLLYVWRIGGDFMSGRFLTAPFFVALILLARVPLMADWRVLAPVALVTLVLGLVSPVSPLRTDESFGATNEAERIAAVGTDRVSDQRAFYFHWTGLAQNINGKQMLTELPEVQAGLKANAKHKNILRTTGMGLASYYAGPATLVVDELALADPFLARLPRKDGWWIVGHFSRCPPLGYARSLKSRAKLGPTVALADNRVQDPALGALYSDVQLATRGELFSPARLAAIWRLNVPGASSVPLNYPCENFYSGKPAPELQVAPF